MSPPLPEVIRLLGALADAPGRAEAASALAASLGADAAVVLVRDPEVAGALVPAPGFPQTLSGGTAWRAFLRRCRAPGWHRGEVAWPGAALAPACACVADDGTALVLLGASGGPDAAPDGVALALPIVGAALRAEQRLVAADGEVRVAREAARDARRLATVLDGMRGELSSALAEASRLNGELQREQAVRERLLGIVGHDLRTPLAAIAMAARVALQRGALGQPDAQAVGRIARSADRMGRMIRQLMDFTRARLGGDLPLALQRVNVDALCRDVIAEFELSQPGAALRYVASGDPVAACDPDRWGEVVSNLVGNALKYGSPDRPVTVTLAGDAAALVLAVHNEGEPIADDLLPVLFDPFRRGRVDHAGTTDSLGLGLYIVGEIIRAHGGTIAVASGPAEGTTFTVRLPRG